MVLERVSLQVLPALYLGSAVACTVVRLCLLKDAAFAFGSLQSKAVR